MCQSKMAGTARPTLCPQFQWRAWPALLCVHNSNGGHGPPYDPFWGVGTAGTPRDIRTPAASRRANQERRRWIPACAGMTNGSEGDGIEQVSGKVADVAIGPATTGNGVFWAFFARKSGEKTTR